MSSAPSFDLVLPAALQAVTFRGFSASAQTLVLGDASTLYAVPLASGIATVAARAPAGTSFVGLTVCGDAFLVTLSDTTIARYDLPASGTPTASIRISSLSNLWWCQSVTAAAALVVHDEPYSVFVTANPGPGGAAIVVGLSASLRYADVSLELDAPASFPGIYRPSNEIAQVCVVDSYGGPFNFNVVALSQDPLSFGPSDTVGFLVDSQDQAWTYAMADGLNTGRNLVWRATAPNGTVRVAFATSDEYAAATSVTVYAFSGATPAFAGTAVRVAPGPPVLAAGPDGGTVTRATLTIPFSAHRVMPLAGPPYLVDTSGGTAVLLLVSDAQGRVHLQQWPLEAPVPDTAWPNFWAAEWAAMQAGPAPYYNTIGDPHWQLWRLASPMLQSFAPRTVPGTRVLV